MASRSLNRIGLVIGGLFMGLFGIAFGLWFYIQAARVDQARTAIGEAVGLDVDAIEDVDFVENDQLRVRLREIAILAEGGDTIVAAPRALMTFDATSLNEEGPLEFFDVELIDPYANLIQTPAGDWNLFQALTVTAAGQPVETDPGRGMVFRDVAIEDGRLRIAMPADPPAPDASLVVNIPRTTIGGRLYQRYDMENVNATLPMVRIGGPNGWRAEIVDLQTNLIEPRLRITQLQGEAEQLGEDGFEFVMETLRFGDSQLSGEGEVRFADTGSLLDVQIRSTGLQLADLQGLMPDLPDEGVARFVLDAESASPERLTLDFSELDLDALESRIQGSIAVAIGGNRPPGLIDAALELAPLDLMGLREIGLLADFPLTGQVTGSVTTAGAEAGYADVNLTAGLLPLDDPTAPVSTVFAMGAVAVGEPDEPLRLDGLEVSFRPLYLASLRGFAPDQSENLRGELSGAITLGGTLTQVSLSDGEIAYDVGGAEPTRLADIRGTVSTDPGLSYDIQADAQPIAFATIQELFPALPFRATTLTGPIAISGDTERVNLEADLTGPSGGLAFNGDVQLGETMVFDISGNVEAFTAGMLLRPEVPVEGPLTGTFSINGTPDDVRFGVDLAQAEGRFVLDGNFRLGDQSPRFDVAGDVSSFRLGSLLGQPGLFPEPMTGNIALNGGAGDPYLFDIDLRGETARLDLSGVFETGDVPVYNIEGFVAGLDLSTLPVSLPVPSTSLTGNVDIEGRGTTVENLAGTFDFNFGDSTVSGMALDQALGRIDVVDGVAMIDTLQIRLEDNFLAASGAWGLQNPAPEVLNFRIRAPDLAMLARLAEPEQLVPRQIAGSLSGEGTIAGSVEYPVVVADLHGEDLVYEDWEVGLLDLNVDGRRDAVVGWRGDLAFDTDDLEVPRVDHFETFRVEASGSQQSLALGIYARRDTESDIALSGLVDLEGTVPQGIGLETMTLRIADATWNLAGPADFRYVSDEGLTIDQLRLLRSGDEAGYIEVDGTIPPRGNAEFRMTAEGVDLADFQQISKLAPAMEGMASINAVLDGPVNAPTLAIQGRVDDLVLQDVLTEQINFGFDYADGQLAGRANMLNQGQQLLTADLSVPMTLSMEDRLVPAIELLDGQPLSAMVRADSLPIETIAAMVPTLEDGVGVVRAQLDVGGTIDAPTLAGSARIVDGAVTVVPVSTRYNQINADIDFAQNTANINRFELYNGGRLAATGAIAFPSGSTPQLQVDANFTDFRLLNDPELAEVNASGAVAIRGPADNAVLTGNIVLNESTIQVPELMQAEPQLELAYAEFGQVGGALEGDLVASAPLGGNIQINGLEVAIGEGVWLESNEMRVQISGNVVLYQDAADLRVFGALQAERGTYELEISGIVRDFEVIRGRVQFFGTGDLNPSLDIVAGYEVPSSTTTDDVTVLVNITGTLLSPRLQLSADTPVPVSEADLISLLIFGQQNLELGGLTGGVGDIFVQEIVGSVIAAQLERPILRAGLCDWVRVQTARTGFRDFRNFGASTFENAVAECGLEVATSLFATIEVGLGGLITNSDFTAGGVGLEWQINDQLMLEGSCGIAPRNQIFRQFDNRILTECATDITRRWEYGRPSGDAEFDLTPDTEPIPAEVGPALPEPSPDLGDPEDSPQTQEPPPDGDGSVDNGQ